MSKFVRKFVTAFFILALAIVFCMSAVACNDETAEESLPEEEPIVTPEEDSVFSGDDIVVVKGGITEFKVVYGCFDNLESIYVSNIGRIANAFEKAYGAKAETVCENTSVKQSKYEIQINTISRQNCYNMMKTLSDGEYAMQVFADKDADTVEICIAHKGGFSLLCAIERFIETYVNGSELILPNGELFKGKCIGDDVIITSDIVGLRDPFVLLEDGTYYCYGTGWVCYKNTTGNLENGWQYMGCVVETPPFCDGDCWAPEVHKYGDKFYMFTTYHSTQTGHRGCAIFVSDSPEGPFVLHSEGHVTPADWDAIDGTFYIDGDGNPWMVFVHEWTFTEDNVGRMSAVRLSADLKNAIGEPIELFRADDPEWAKDGVTDGCFMYTTADGNLLMLWSNFDKEGYALAIAESDNGKLDGNWTQCERLFTEVLTEQKDGGHGMVFKDINGNLYISEHSPNKASIGPAVPVFFLVQEEFGMLTWDLYH